MSLRNDQVVNVLKAVTLNGKSILLTALLATVVIYIYSIIAFWFLRNDYANGQILLECATLYECLVATFNLGIRSGGGIGDVLATSVWGDPTYAGRFIFDISFFIVIIIILLNIVFGIILDTFGELRDERSKIEEDIRTNCFICSMGNDQLNDSVLGFEHHIKHEHNMWHYLYFFIFIDEKDQDEYTQAEEYVAKKRSKGDHSYFPVGKAIFIEKFSNKKKYSNISNKFSFLFSFSFLFLKKKKM